VAVRRTQGGSEAKKVHSVQTFIVSSNPVHSEVKLEHEKGGTLKRVFRQTFPMDRAIRRVQICSKPTGSAGNRCSGNGGRFDGSGFFRGCRGVLGRRLLLFPDRGTDHRDVIGLDALGAFADGEFDELAFPQRTIAVLLNGAVVDKNVRSIFPCDETIAFGVVEPLDSALFTCTHCDTFHNNRSSDQVETRSGPCPDRNPLCPRLAGSNEDKVYSAIIIPMNRGKEKGGNGRKHKKIRKKLFLYKFAELINV